MTILGKLEKLNTVPSGHFKRELTEVASFLLNSCILVVGKTRCRLVELELYYHSKQHPDPFVHQDILQKEFGKWYLHRKGGTLKNGTFKGIDFTFGTPNTYAAFLIRSIENSSGELIDGSCLCVEFIMNSIGVETVSDLRDLVEGPGIVSVENPFRFECLPEQNVPVSVYDSPGVGLTLKGKTSDSNAKKFLVSKYRFMTEPRRVKKGRAELIYSFVDSEMSPSAIRQLTGSPIKLIDKYYSSKNAELRFEIPETGIVKPIDFWGLARCGRD